MGGNTDQMRADLERIRECADAILGIHDTFANSANPAEGYGKSELGATTLLDAFDDFEDNWSIRRGKLTDELKALGDIVAGAAEMYEGIDRELAQALRDNDAAREGAS
ncbi:hypothetical protein H7827_20075 [Streptomyces sp. JH002]|uniref:Uncharacterized protein n=2 Tax=Streptomyces TaxID=1883 RepID=A0A0F7FTM0_9ACTN|nr:hypothetical protein [Streptomyces sp. NRRL F-2890]AKG43072.1 hypothetical protein SXIM_16880 [Streptomyces xiamenensis]QQN79311.1 hypothetical protein IPZ77_19135 [Streptomyces sp. XC 2026]